MKIYILSFISGLVLFACNGSRKDGQNTSADSTTASNQEQIKKNIQNELSQYAITPPDTSYTGEYVDKYPNGNTKFRGYFRFGKRHGQWMAWYTNGTLWSECFYDKGLKHGINNVYYESGKIRYKAHYKNDLRDSVWIFYDEFGAELKRVKFKDDVELPGN